MNSNNPEGKEEIQQSISSTGEYIKTHPELKYRPHLLHK